jgi:hypothetical protein
MPQRNFKDFVPNFTKLTSGFSSRCRFSTFWETAAASWRRYTWIAPFSPSQGISDAMNALFKKAVAQARLTR